MFTTLDFLHFDGEDYNHNWNIGKEFFLIIKNEIIDYENLEVIILDEARKICSKNTSSRLNDGIEEYKLEEFIRRSKEFAIYFDNDSNEIISIAGLSGNWIHIFCTKQRGGSKKLMDFILYQFREKGYEEAKLVPNSNELAEWYMKKFGFEHQVGFYGNYLRKMIISSPAWEG